MMCDKLEFVIIVNRCRLEVFELSALYEFMQFNGDISQPTTRVAEFWKFFGITKSIIYLIIKHIQNKFGQLLKKHQKDFDEKLSIINNM